MRRLLGLACLGSLCLSTGCLRHAYDPIGKDSLGEAVFFAEQSGEQWTLHSAPSESTEMPAEPPKPATRRPAPALVDMDSRIYIYVDKSRVALDEGGHDLTDRFARIKRQREKAEAVLDEIAGLTRARSAAIEAYRTGQADFEERKRQYGLAEGVLLDELFKRFADELEALEDIAEEDPAGVYAGLARWFEGRIQALNGEYRSLERAVEQEGIALRLEAWLLRGDQLIPLRVPDYNTLEEGRIRLADRFGLDLSTRQREKLEQEMAANAAFARRANQVLDGEKRLVEVVIKTLDADLAELVVEGQGLAAKYNSRAIKERFRQAMADSQAFFDAVARRAEILSADARDQLGGLPEELGTWIAAESSQVQAVLSLIGRLEQVRGRWSGLHYGEVASAIGEAQQLIGELRAVKFPGLVLVGRKATEVFLHEISSPWVPAAGRALEELLGSAEGVAFLARVDETVGNVAELAGFTSRAADRMDQLGKQFRREHVLLTTIPESLDVSFDQIKDTVIDLRRTDREPGDMVRVRATRLKAGEARGETQAEFEVRRFGWYAKLSPAVVLARPDQLRGSNDGFRFAPTLSWLHHYVPRPGEIGAYLVAGLRPALGIHTAFLSFDGDDSDAIQIGLGGTASLWEGRLQAGCGYNLMADSRVDGRIYFFIGTDLIGLLQTAGIVAP